METPLPFRNYLLETITGEKIYLIIDRLTVDMAQEGISRLTDSVETAFAEGKVLVC